MKRLLIIGCGDVGLRVALLLQSRYRIYALTHSTERLAGLRARSLIPLVGDLDQSDTLAGLAGLAHEVIHLAPPPGNGRWSWISLPTWINPMSRTTKRGWVRSAT